MFYRHKGKVFGVLNDFDLAVVDNKASSTTSERTGTLPFMALDLLTEKGLVGGVEHVYRHDLESFWWVLVWIIFRLIGGKLRDNPPLSDWNDGFAVCRTSKAYSARPER